MGVKGQLSEDCISEIESLKREIKEIKKGFSSKKKSQMFIPGKRIGITNRFVNVNSGKKDLISDLRLPIDSFVDLVAPIGHVIFRDGKLKVYAVCFINKEYELTYNEFTFYYDFSLNNSGEHQLNIFITFNEEERKTTDYKYYSFEFDFEKGAVHCANGSEVPMEKIKTVQFFLINTDPETSRGTETTVQSGDD